MILCVLLGIAARLISIDKEFTADEPDFVKAAEAIAKTGHPTFYHSEQQPRETALWHPPMYIYLASIAIFFSSDAMGIRAINVIFTILTAAAIFLFCINFFEEENKKIVGLIATSFFLINYYILSSSIIIDIDPSSMLFVFLFIFFLLLSYKKSNKGYLILSGVCLLLSIFNRYPIAFLVYVILGGYHLANKGLRKNFGGYLLLGILSASAFLIIWAGYSSYIEPGTFFSFIQHNAKLGSQQLSSLFIYGGSFVINLVQFVRLFTFPATILLIFSLFYFLKHGNDTTNFLLTSSFGVFLFFVLLPRPAFGYPRYFMTIMPGFSILIGLFVYRTLNKVRNKKSIFRAFLVFFLTLFILLLLKPQLSNYSSDGLIKATNLPDFAFNLLASLPLLLIFLEKKVRKVSFVLFLTAMVLSYSLYFDLGFVLHSEATKEAGEYLRKNTGVEDLIIAPKSVAYYAERKVYVNENNKPAIEFSKKGIINYLIKSLENRNMNSEFFWPKGFFSSFYPPQPSLSEVKAAKYAVLYHPVQNKIPEKIIGEFFIYRLNE